MRPIRVLFIHHYGRFGGSSRSLLELIAAFPAETVEPCLLTPEGNVVDVFSRAGVRCVSCRGISLLDNTRYSHYRGLRWLVLLREIVRIPSTVSGVRAVRRQFSDFDVIHVNEVAMVLALALASRVYCRPSVVHVRAVQRQRSGWVGRLMSAVLERHASAVIAIDETVRRSLPKDLRVPVSVIHNGFSPPSTHASAVAELKSRVLVIAMIGNLLRVKGCREFVEAAAICKSEGLAVRFVFVGANGRTSVSRRSRLLRRLGFEQDIEYELRQIVSRRNLEDIVEFRPFTADLSSVYRAIDVVCFPSHLDAPGRPIFEAAFFGVPSVAAISDPTPDTFVDGETGLRIPAHSPGDLAGAVRYLLSNPEVRARLGENARMLAARQFDARRNALAVLEVYRSLVDSSGDRTLSRMSDPTAQMRT